MAAPPVLYQKLHDSGRVEKCDQEQEEEMRRRRRLETTSQVSHVITAVLITDHCGDFDVVSPANQVPTRKTMHIYGAGIHEHTGP